MLCVCRPCLVQVTFTLRNHSITNPVRTTLKLASRPPPSPPIPSQAQPTYVSLLPLTSPLLTSSNSPTTSPLLPAPYTGKLTHHHALLPTEARAVRASLWAARPGSYELDAWGVETEVGERARGEGGTGEWSSRGLRYLQGARKGERACVTVVDVRAPALPGT